MKKLLTFMVVFLLCITGCSSSSKDTKKETTDKKTTVSSKNIFKEKVENLIKTEGYFKETKEETGDYYQGIVYLDLIDFNNDNQDELVVYTSSYKNGGPTVVCTIYQNVDNQCKQVYQGQGVCYNEDGNQYISIVKKDNNNYIVTDTIDGAAVYVITNYQIVGFKDDKFGVTKTFEEKYDEEQEKTDSASIDNKKVDQDTWDKEFNEWIDEDDDENAPIVYPINTSEEENDVYKQNRLARVQVYKIFDQLGITYQRSVYYDKINRDDDDYLDNWNGKTTFKDDGTIEREIWREKEYGTYSTSKDGKTITAKMTKQLTNSPADDGNDGSDVETKDWALTITYKIQDDGSMKVTYSDDKLTSQNADTIYMY